MTKVTKDKLKTMNDDMIIIAGIIGSYKYSGETNTAEKVAENILEFQRKKAIKWVKKFTEQGIHQWEMKLFKEFHNITEDDLK